MEPEALEFICGCRCNPFHRKNELANNSQPQACLPLAEFFLFFVVFFFQFKQCPLLWNVFAFSVVLSLYYGFLDFEVQVLSRGDLGYYQTHTRYGGKFQFRLNCICLPTNSHLHLHLSQSLFLGKHFSHMLCLGGKIQTPGFEGCHVCKRKNVVG